MAALVGSATVPVIEAVSCATSATGRQNANAKMQNHRRRDFMFNSLNTRNANGKPSQALNPEAQPSPKLELEHVTLPTRNRPPTPATPNTKSVREWTLSYGTSRVRDCKSSKTVY